MKRASFIIFLTTCVLAATTLYAVNDKSPQERYIERYSALAVEEMYRSGIPASITLAQGLLESRYGLSELAVDGNNHFGIKCHNWSGGKMYYDDDRKGECFRKYLSPEDSFRDHSDFLRYRDRYKFLFDLDPTDYKGWAHGLKKAGYATDPSYPHKLIKLIEEYELYRFDTEPSSRDDAERKVRKRKKSNEKKPQERPQAPSVIEQAKPLDEKQRETFHFALSRQMYSMNGVPFVYATVGETYSSIAARYNLFLREILRFNDLKEEETLYPGTIVYLQKKKKEAAYGMDKYVVEGTNENLRNISQRFAVSLDKLCKMNDCLPDRRLKDGDVIILRK
ncbi:MAG: glucosaminidase domain-containing protein [Bacteroidales bacterium]|nr:glucosaminidase domain-containing protein [Bacteroidales bacterium]